MDNDKGSNDSSNKNVNGHGQADASTKSWLRWLLPCLDWLTEYRATDALSDALAGLFVAVLLVPQAMAYAALAELPPQVGLYASIVPVLLYTVFGASRFLSIGPVALVSLLVADTLGQVGSVSDVEPTAAALALAMIVGLTLLVLGTLRLGFIINFISDAVIVGFTSAAALLIATSQLRHLLGLELERGDNFFATMAQLTQQLDQTHIVTALIGGTVLLVLILVDQGLSRWLKKRGMNERLRLVLTKIVPLLLLVLSIILVWQFNLHEQAGVAIVGELNSGPPSFAIPPLQPQLWLALLPGGLLIALIIFVAAMAVAKSLAGRRRQKISPNQEAVVVGLANLAAGVTGGYPVGASLSRSALNYNIGAHTPAASAVTAALVLLTVAFLGPLFFFLPKAMLAALVMAAVVGLFDLKGMYQVWRYSKTESVTLALTFISVLAFGIQWGLLAGAAAGLLLYLWRTSRPRIIVEGQLGGSDEFRSIERDEVKPEISPVLVLRIDQDLYFANAGHCEQQVLATVNQYVNVNCLLLDLKSVSNIDHSGFAMLDRLIENLEQAGVMVSIAETKVPVQENLRQAGLLKRLGDERVFKTAAEAVERLNKQGDV